MSFSGYSFCRSPLASYAMVSFKSCYLKSHFPAEFMGAVMSHGGGFTLSLLFGGVQAPQFKNFLPDINLSEVCFQGYGAPFEWAFNS